MMTNQSWGKKENNKRHAYREGGGYACHKNGLNIKKIGRACH
jgi:hypothetical protein